MRRGRPSGPWRQEQIDNPSQTHLVLITDLYEGGDAKAVLCRAAALVNRGVNFIVLLALSDDGRPTYGFNRELPSARFERRAKK